MSRTEQEKVAEVVGRLPGVARQLGYLLFFGVATK
jgi:hypothetical protein